jgi:tetratricopeptide (TPR) repeat protein
MASNVITKQTPFRPKHFQLIVNLQNLMQMKTLKLFVFVLISQVSLAQVPNLSVSSDKQSEPLRITKLDINIEVVGNVATTTFDMVFYNPNARDLEGKLSMPLKNGQEIYRYALDVNGKLREGVIVEKVKARQAYEAVVRQNIDPGIINKTKGNNFTTRIYPVPANGNKRVVLALSETLTGDDKNLYYALPFGEKKTYDNFSLYVKVIKSKNDDHEVISEFKNVKFDSEQDAYLLNYTKQNFEPEKPLKFTIPRFSEEGYSLFTCDFEGETYFYLSMKPDALKSTMRTQPKHIAIYWDNSHSASKRDMAKEIAFLKRYLESFDKQVDVTVYGFNFEITSKQGFPSSHVNKIIEHIQSFKNDGATRLDNLHIDKDIDQVLLFSDGVNTLGEEQFDVSVPLFAFTSGHGNNDSFLKHLAQRTNGELIDLTITNIDNALRKLTSDQEKFLSCTYNKSEIKEVYPKYPQTVGNYFEVSGILLNDKAELKIHFGSSGLLPRSKQFTIKKSGDSPMVSRIWATKKIAFLNGRFDENKNPILELSKKHNIVTKNTSLLVLDRVEDYVAHNIIPPVELREEFEKLMAQKESLEEKGPDLAQIQNNNIERLKVLTNWYDKITTKDPNPNALPIEIRSPESFGEVSDYNNDNTENGNRSISGVIVDAETHEPIAFVNIAIQNQGSSVAGAVTDLNGGFSITYPVVDNPILSTAYVGYEKVKIDISQSFPLQIKLNQIAVEVEEVIVVESDIEFDETIEIEILDEEEQESEEAPFAMIQTNRMDDQREDQMKKKMVDKTSKPSIKVLAWKPDAAYIKILKETDDKDLLSTYFKLKSENENRPSFYVEVSDLFFAKGKHDLGVQILSNAIELDLENPELLKTVAKRLLSEKEYELAIGLYKEIEALRPEEPQSYRDLALAYEQSGQYQEALDMFLHVLDTNWERFENIKPVVLNEINALIALHGNDLDLSSVNKEYIKAMPLDVRITIEWSSNDNDIDLWVIDPKGEKCFYKNKLTEIGGRISDDFTQGYGPEEFSLKEAVRGFYNVYVNYFGDSRQSITGPVTVYATMTTNYGRATQKTENITLQLEKSKDKKTIQIGQLTFEK